MRQGLDMKLTIYLIILFSTAWLTACQSPQPKPEQRMAEQVETLLQSRMEELNISGLAVGLVHEGDIISARGYGYADGTLQQQAVTPDMGFQIGSTSKLFTALAVMQLVESGQLALDEDIRTYLPAFNPKTLDPDNREVTLRNLLSHHSGIPSSFLKDFVLAEPDPEAFMATSQWLSDTYLTWPNQTVFAYCNVCYSLMGELIANVSQQSYESYVQDHIFQPLNLTHSQVFGVPGTGRNVSGFTAGEPAEPLIIKDVPAGSYLMSARDMARFAKALVDTAQGEQSGWIMPRTLNAMFEPQNEGLPMDADFSIGLGFWLSNHESYPIVGHGGTIPPFYSELKVIPETGTAVFIASNDNMGHNMVLDQLASEVFDLLLPKRAASVGDGSHQPPATPIADGHYNLGGLGLLTITTEGTGRYVELPGAGRLPAQEAQGVLHIPDMNLTLKPYDHSLIRFHGYYGTYLLGPATDVEQTENNGEYDAWLGRYASEDMIESARLYYDDTQRAYVFEAEMGVLDEQFSFLLKPLGPQLMQVQGYGRNLGNVVQLRMQNGQAGLYYSGIELTRQ